MCLDLGEELTALHKECFTYILYIHKEYYNITMGEYTDSIEAHVLLLVKQYHVN